MAEIMLTRGFVAIVDGADLDWLSQWKCQAHSSNRARAGGTYYAQRSCRRDESGRRPCLTMHRAIMGSPVGLVDHRNGNTLDNRRDNLRVCSPGQSACNRRTFAGKDVPYKGVTHREGRFYALIQFEGERYALGGHSTPEEAARAYDRKARSLHGEFALLNFPDEAA